LRRLGVLLRVETPEVPDADDGSFDFPHSLAL
jgi:hypothetical protein